MNKDILERAGRILFGEHWVKPFCNQFGLSNRTLRRIMKDKAEVHEDLTKKLEIALHDHGHRLDTLLENFV